MSTLFSHLKDNCIEFLKELSTEEIAEMIVNNELSFVAFRNIQLKKDFAEMVKPLDSKKMQIYCELEEMYCLKERAIIDVVKS